MKANALEIRGLTAFLEGPSGLRRILDGVNLRVGHGRAFALLGESGSGKTLLFHSVLGLHPGVPGVVGGECRLLDVDVFGGLSRLCTLRDGTAPRIEKDTAAWNRAVRRRLAGVLGHSVTLIPQDPLTALPPFHDVERLMMQALRMGLVPPPAGEIRGQALAWLQRVHIYGAEEVARRFVHELSGGMAQRFAVALALAPRPRFVVADEPTTGLDATLRVRIIDLLAAAAEHEGVTLCLISHDLEAARLLAQDVAILCLGRVVESGPAGQVLDRRASPKHPYTAFLLEAESRLIGGGGGLPRVDASVQATAARPGCSYRLRCPNASAACAKEEAELVQVGAEHWIACREAAA